MADWKNITDAAEVFRDLTVTGVKRYYRYPPGSLDLTGGPVAFPLWGSATRGEQISTCIADSKQHNLQYIVVVQATGQGTQEANMNAIFDMLDNVMPAMDALSPDTFNFIDYGLSWNGNYAYGGSEYWAVIADIVVRHR